MLEYYTELEAQTTTEELEQRMNDYLLTDGYTLKKSKRNRRYTRCCSQKTEFFEYRNSFEPDIEIGNGNNKIKLFYKYHLSVKIFLYIWLSVCAVFQGLVLTEELQSANGLSVVVFIPTFMFLFGVILSSLILFITAKIRLGELKRAIGYSGKTKMRIKLLKQS